MNTSKRAVLMIAAIAALMPLGAPGAEARAIPEANTSAASGLTTAFDRAIDLMVQQRVAARKLSAAEALVAREQLQLQFLSLTNAEQRSLVANARLNSEEGVHAAMTALNNAVNDAARQALAEAQAGQQANQAGGQVKPKLGSDGDLVFVATVGPCRVFDSRFGPGPLGGLASRQIFGYSVIPGYPWGFDQGGTGTAGDGNCAGTVYTGTPPVSVVATVGVFNTFSTGSMRAWNGGTTLTVGGILGWNAGDVLANTTVIPMDRSIVPFPGSGLKRDFALNNNSGTPIDYVVDVVGYFIENQATALDCTVVSSGTTLIAAGTSSLVFSPACPAGYTFITAQPQTFVFGVYTGTLDSAGCRISNTTGVAVGVVCDSQCCRIPGR